VENYAGNFAKVEMKFHDFTFPTPSSARIRPANKSPIILLFIPAESDTKAVAMDDEWPGIINEQRSRTGGQHD
jgi:hypothetical protein